jgi:hypothetical protein
MKSIAEVLDLLAASYPRTELEAETVKAYILMLEGIDPALLKAAVLQHISTSKWFPTIAEIRGAAVEIKMQVANQPPAPEAWGMVMQELRRVGHWRTPQLPPDIQQAVNAIGGWRHLCFSENITADRARFLEAYASQRRRQTARLQQLPAVAALREELAGQQEKLELPTAVNLPDEISDDQPDPEPAAIPPATTNDENDP